MALSRTLWRSKFALDYLPPWTCPVCAKGTLNGSKATIKSIENSQSKSERHDEDWSPEWIRGSFYGLLKCTNCRESILMIGQMAVEEDVEYDEQTGGSSYSHAEFLSPIAFTPTIHIFPIHPHIPDIIKDAIVTSFKVYWADIESCGNKIRIVLELIMDSQKIPKTYLNAKGKKMGYSLHARIDHFKKSHPEEAELLMAIKWIGNSGSHTGGELTRDDLLDAYEILEHVVTKLYEKDTKRLRKLSKAINKKKKPIGKGRHRRRA